MQRLRLTFGRDEKLKYISHLDMLRLWERALRRAEIQLTYSEGFNPHPRISTAAPLAVGMTSVCELMDIYLDAITPIAALLQKVSVQLPPGLWISSAEEVDPQAASLASALRFAEYEVGLDIDLPIEKTEGRLAALLAAKALPRQRMRDGQVKRYDLRPLIAGLRMIHDSSGRPTLCMQLQASPVAAGRPEEVVAELGITGLPQSIKRVGLILETRD